MNNTQAQAYAKLAMLAEGIDLKLVESVIDHMDSLFDLYTDRILKRQLKDSLKMSSTCTRRLLLKCC